MVSHDDFTQNGFVRKKPNLQVGVGLAISDMNPISLNSRNMCKTEPRVSVVFIVENLNLVLNIIFVNLLLLLDSFSEFS